MRGQRMRIHVYWGAAAGSDADAGSTIQKPGVVMFGCGVSGIQAAQQNSIFLAVHMRAEIDLAGARKVSLSELGAQ